MATKLKNLLLGLSLFYQSLYVPIAIMVYLPCWYRFNCTRHPLCAFLGKSEANRLIAELTAFFRHTSALGDGWSSKERLHLAEVRDLLDILLILALISVIGLVITIKQSRLSRYARFNLLAIPGLVVIVLFFEYFWVNIFHPLLFANDYWKTNPADRSFYIMPAIFFKNSIIFLISASSILNAIIWLCFRRTRNNK